MLLSTLQDVAFENCQISCPKDISLGSAGRLLPNESSSNSIAYVTVRPAGFRVQEGSNLPGIYAVWISTTVLSAEGFSNSRVLYESNLFGLIFVLNYCPMPIARLVYCSCGTIRSILKAGHELLWEVRMRLRNFSITLEFEALPIMCQNCFWKQGAGFRVSSSEW